MRHRFIPPLALAILSAPFLTAPGAAEQFTLEPKIYVFKNSDLQEGHEKATAGETKAHNIVFKSPATIHFTQDSLTLDGTEFRWSNGQAVPANINPVSAPALKMTAGQSVSVRCASSAQYMERLDTGGFQLREISPDSPDAPRYALTFSVQPAFDLADSLNVTCTPEIAIVQGRDKITGVELEIGKPVMAVFKDKIEFSAQLNEWIGLLFRSPSDSEYSVLTLLKISRDQAPGSSPAPRSLPAAIGINKTQRKTRNDDRLIGVSVRTDKTAEGEKLPQPSPEHPAYYLAYDAGYKDLIPMSIWEGPPTSAVVDQTLRVALAHQGYLPASGLTPPSLVILCYREASGVEIGSAGAGGDGPYGERGGGSTESFAIIDHVILSAYDYKDLCRHERTLLWRVQISAERHDITTIAERLHLTTSEVQPTLVACAGVNSGVISSKTVNLRVPLLDPNPAENKFSRDSAPFSIPVEFAGQIDDATVRHLIKNEWERIVDRLVAAPFLPVSNADKTPHASLNTEK